MNDETALSSTHVDVNVYINNGPYVNFYSKPQVSYPCSMYHATFSPRHFPISECITNSWRLRVRGCCNACLNASRSLSERRCTDGQDGTKKRPVHDGNRVGCDRCISINKSVPAEIKDGEKKAIMAEMTATSTEWPISAPASQ